MLCAPKCLFSRDVIHFKSVRNLKIYLTSGNGWKLPRINLSFEHLEKVEMGLQQHTIIDQVLEFFKEHPSITKLTFKLDAQSFASKENMMKIVSVLPMLKDLTFFGANWAADEVADS